MKLRRQLSKKNSTRYLDQPPYPPPLHITLAHPHHTHTLTPPPLRTTKIAPREEENSSVEPLTTHLLLPLLLLLPLVSDRGNLQPRHRNKNCIQVLSLLPSHTYVCTYTHSFSQSALCIQVYIALSLTHTHTHLSYITLSTGRERRKSMPVKRLSTSTPATQLPLSPTRRSLAACGAKNEPAVPEGPWGRLSDTDRVKRVKALGEQAIKVGQQIFHTHSLLCNLLFFSFCLSQCTHFFSLSQTQLSLSLSIEEEGVCV